MAQRVCTPPQPPSPLAHHWSQGGACCSLLLSSLFTAWLALRALVSLLPVKWCMHYWEIMPDKFILYWKQYHNRFITYHRLVAGFSEKFPGERFFFSPWLLNYHLYLFESWVFRNGLNQWNKKGRCLMVFRWVLKISSGITKWCLSSLLQKPALGSIPLLPTAHK